MKTTGLIAAFMSMVIFSSVSDAYAKNVFMLRLGTYQSEEEAKSKWDALKKDHAKLLESLEPSLSEVPLEDGNGKAFRVETGPITSKTKAQSVCSKLYAKSETCFVVETARYVAPNKTDKDVVVADASSSAKYQPDNAAKSLDIPEEGKPHPWQSRRGKAEAVAAPEVAKAETSDKDEGIFPWFTGLFSSDEEAKQEPKKLSSIEQQTAVNSTVVETPNLAPSARISAYERRNNARKKSLEPAKAAYQPSVVTAQKKAPVFIKPAPTPLAVKSKDSKTKTAQVDVAEAIRVPLSSDKPSPKTATYQRIEVPSGFPSQAGGQRTLWAKLSFFKDEDAATGFWEEFRYNNPDVTYGVRARITRPYNATARDGQISLRVGPFAYNDNVKDICNLAQKSGLTCAAIADIGSAAANQRPRVRNIAPEYNRHQNNKAAVAIGRTMYWLHLGSYNSAQEADYNWKQIKRSNSALLGRMGSTISTPARSSNPEKLFRLRTGPFQTSLDAMNMCGKLKAKGVGCIVVSSR